MRFSLISSYGFSDYAAFWFNYFALRQDETAFVLTLNITLTFDSRPFRDAILAFPFYCRAADGHRPNKGAFELEFELLYYALTELGPIYVPVRS
jgi:hypothetical protein